MAIAGALVLAFLAQGPVRASTPTAANHQTEMKARESFAAGRFDEALESFARLYAETLHPVYLRNIGRCHQKLREPQKAIDSFQDYLAKATSVSPQEKAEIDGYIREMEALRATQTQAGAASVATPAILPVSPPILIATPLAQAGTAPPPPPGASLARPNTDGPEPAASPFYTRWWFWTAAGVVVAGGVVTALVLSSGSSRPPCTSTCM